MATRTDAEITFSGPPNNLRALVSFATDEKVLPVTLKLGGEPAVFRSYIKPFGPNRSEVRLSVPRETAPGRYDGVATIAGKPLPIVANIEAVLRIRVLPKQTALTGDAGARADFQFSIVNAGNVAFEVPKAVQLDLDDADRQDRALGRALRATLPAGEKRVDRFFEELRVTHGGEAGISVQSGSGALAPGASVEVHAVLEIPATVQAGREYVGVWPLGNAGHVIEVQVKRGGTTPNGGRNLK